MLLMSLVRLLDAAHTCKQGLHAWTGNALTRLISGGLLRGMQTTPAWPPSTPRCPRMPING